MYQRYRTEYIDDHQCFTIWIRKYQVIRYNILVIFNPRKTVRTVVFITIVHECGMIYDRFPAL